MQETSPSKKARNRKAKRLKKQQQLQRTINEKSEQYDKDGDISQSDSTDRCLSSSQESTPVKKCPNDVVSSDLNRGIDNDLELKLNEKEPEIDADSASKENLDSSAINPINIGGPEKSAKGDEKLIGEKVVHEDLPTQNTLDRDRAKKKHARDRSRDYKELKERLESQNSQMAALTNHVKQQTSKIRELETFILSTTRNCNQLEKLLQQEVNRRNKLEQENICLNQTVTRLRAQISVHEKNKLANDELMRTTHATLMERETEVSLLKLKLTRLQTNSFSNTALNSSVTSVPTSVKNDPSRIFIDMGRSMSEFDKNSYVKETPTSDQNIRLSTSQLKTSDRDASVWASVPPELTPSKRPQLLEKNIQAICNESKHGIYGNQNVRGKIERSRNYKTMPARSNRGPDNGLLARVAKEEEFNENSQKNCLVTNLDDSGSKSDRSMQGAAKLTDNEADPSTPKLSPTLKHEKDNVDSKSEIPVEIINESSKPIEVVFNAHNLEPKLKPVEPTGDLPLPSPIKKTPTTPIRGLKRIFDKFRRSDSTASSGSKTDLTDAPESPFKRGTTRATAVGLPGNSRSHVSPRAIEFHPDKPFAEWDSDMIVEWMTKIGLSMYTTQCKRWVKCGAHIMNATPMEVDRGLGIMNHLHRKKLRLAISELNGDCDKITKAASKLDYLWVARWLDDIGLPQYKEAFIDARIDGRVLNYLTIDDLVSMGIKSVLHHTSIKCGIKVLRSIEFDLLLLKRRATSDEIDEMNQMRQRVGQTQNLPKQPKNVETKCLENPGLPLWTCHRVMEWLRLIDFGEFSPNLRGSGVHGGLIVFEDGFNIDTMCSLLSISQSRTLLRRQLLPYFENLIGQALCKKKMQFKELSPNTKLDPQDEIKTPKKKPLWFGRLKSPKVGQDRMDDYLCPMYPVEPQIIKSISPARENGESQRQGSKLAEIPESINV